MKLPEKFKQIFDVALLQQIDPGQVWEAISDNEVRRTWVEDVFGELQALNLKVDDCIFRGDYPALEKLSSKRQILQQILENLLTIHKRQKHQNRHKP